MKHLLYLLIFIGQILQCNTAFTATIQEIELKSNGTHLIRPHAFTLHNNSYNRMAFFLSPDGKNWTKHRLQADQIHEFSDGKSESFTIRIPTQDKGSVIYRLETSRRYQIYWNDSKQRWDMTELSTR